MKKRIIFTVLMIILLACVLSAHAFAAKNGYCGDPNINNGQNVTWTLDDSGTLTINGSGDTKNSLSYTAWDSYRSQITNVNISSGVTSIGERAFSDCSSLISINIPDSVTSIGYEAFYYCSSLTSINIPDSVTSIGHGAFTGCSSLTSINIPDSVTSIGDFAFDGCSSLTSINIPDGVTGIGKYAFNNCSSLTNITIPDSVTSIGHGAFTGCSSLTSVYITDLEAWCKVTFGNEYSNSFQYTYNLYLNGTKVEALEIPDTVQVIPGRAFQYASCIKTVFIPKSVIGIAANAFAGCSGIEKVIYEGSEAEWNDIAISSGNEYLVNAPRFYNSTLSEYYFTVSCEICAGGTLSVDKNAFAPGETVTVTASPYSGYELTAIYVDGEILDGNTFPASKNHVVSAKFERFGGSDDCRIGDISVTGPDGNPCQTVPQGTFLATVPITNKTNIESVTVMLASYSSSGRFRGMAWLTFKNLPAGVTVDVTLPVDNTSGDVAELRAFVVDSLQSISPLGSAVSFGK